MDGFDLFFGAYALADDKTRDFMKKIAPDLFEPMTPETEALLRQAVEHFVVGTHWARLVAAHRKTSMRGRSASRPTLAISLINITAQ
jgi:hypothetical protein